MQQNSPELWDGIWNSHKSEADDLQLLESASREIRWARIRSIVRERLGGFKGRRVIEIGAGAGTYSALMQQEGAEVVVADYSEKAIERARAFFEHNNQQGNFLLINALDLPDDLLGKFDISMSFGLTEHFLEPNRFAINKAHIDLVRLGGLSFISVPNAYNPFYRFYKFVAERTGRWTVGEEYPYSRRELTKMCKRMGVEDFWFIGDSFIKSTSFVNRSASLLKNIVINEISRLPVGWRLVRFLNNMSSTGLYDKNTQVLKCTEVQYIEKGTFIDSYYSYALVLCVQKNREARS